MKTHLAKEEIAYTGKELRSHWVLERFGLKGDAIVAFVGTCMVAGKDLVDVEDFRSGQIVAASRMLHFIVEIFRIDLIGIVFAQRLLCSIVTELINSRLGCARVERKGDDLFVGDGKLSVSIATVSPVSGLIHLGLNITDEGVPVKASCLDELGVDPHELATGVLEQFSSEVDSCFGATGKVRPVN